MGSGRHAMGALLGVWLLVLAGAVPAFAEGRHAFVVGIDAYPQLGPDAQLRRAVNDAEAVGDTLAGIGFTVTRVTRGADLAPLLSRFGQFLTTIGPGDTVVFFYAGHGISLDDGTFLLPSDVPALKPTDELLAKRVTLSEREISTQLRATGARAALVVLDACRNNPFPPRGTRAIGNSRQGLTRMTAADGVFTLYSAREGQTALDGIADDGGRNSVFTRIFIETLKKPGVSISELGESVRDEVATLARSAGHDQVPAVYNDLIGARKLYLAGPPQEAKTQEVKAEDFRPQEARPDPPKPERPAQVATLAPPAREAVPPAPEPVAEMPDWCAHGGARTRIERIICADPALGRSDVALNRVYVARAAGLSGLPRLRFVQESRDWIRERDARCGLGTDAAVRTCLLAAIEERTEALASPARRAEPETEPPQRPDWCANGAPKNQVERVICSDPRLALWDIRLNRLYTARVARLSGTTRIRFVQESREWILERNVRCGSGPVGVIRACLLAAVEERAREIGP